jgi:arylsulfatase A-like enzyme
MPEPFRGTINVDIRDSEPDWAPFEPPKAPEGAPNVVYIVLDDVGFSAMSCYGGPIETPNIDRIAAAGVRYTQWHTTALCSPTRSCLLTGRNHTRNSMACITEAAIGFPNGSGTIPPENGMLSEILGERGWNTYMVGKWHLCPTDEMNLASTRRNWPSGRGFERWYGFLGAETNQWYPDLVYDNHPVDQPRTPEEGYHLTDDLTDKALEFIKDAKAIAPDKPFFLYYAPGACHAPHHAPRGLDREVQGRFDAGYEAIREQTLARQKEMGIVPPDTELPPVNPIGTPETRQGPDGQPFPPLDTTRPWDSLNQDEKRLFARMAEVYAGFLAHADHSCPPSWTCSVSKHLKRSRGTSRPPSTGRACAPASTTVLSRRRGKRSSTPCSDQDRSGTRAGRRSPPIPPSPAGATSTTTSGSSTTPIPTGPRLAT